MRTEVQQGKRTISIGVQLPIKSSRRQPSRGNVLAEQIAPLSSSLFLSRAITIRSRRYKTVVVVGPREARIDNSYSGFFAGAAAERQIRGGHYLINVRIRGAVRSALFQNR